MTFFTDDEKLHELRRTIRERQRAGDDPRRISIMRSLASDMEARADRATDNVIRDFDIRMRGIENAPGDSANRIMMALARDFMAKWPVVRAALMTHAEAMRNKDGEGTDGVCG